MTRLVVVVLALALVIGAAGCKQSKRAPAPAPVRPVPVRALPEEIVQCVNTEVAAGFATPDDIVESCVGAAEDDGTVDRRRVERLVARALEKHKSEELGWRGLTDCDRLDAAFARMEKHGIVARQNFSDCGTCGAAEIEEEANALVAAGKKVTGFAFYHMQDTEGAVDGSGLYLSYGSLGVDDGDAASLGIGRRVVRILKENGLPAEWNGKIERRIGIPGLKWQRRRFTRAPEVAAIQTAPF
jgi:hypothetical protein